MKTIKGVSPIKVLVVDDDEQLRQTLVQMLKRNGLALSEATGGNHAVEVLKNEPADFVISDIEMPNGTGFELIENLRASSLGHIPVILMSGGLELEETEWKARGAAHFIHKPFSSRDLLRIFQQLGFQIAS